MRSQKHLIRLSLFLTLGSLCTASPGKTKDPEAYNYAEAIQNLVTQLKTSTPLADKARKIRETNELYLKKIEELRVKASKDVKFQDEYSRAFDLYDQLIPLIYLVYVPKTNAFSQKECLEAIGLIENSNSPAPGEDSENIPLKPEALEIKDLIANLCK